MHLLIWLWMVRIYRRARRHAMLRASEVVRADPRATVLYLRSFKDDRAIRVRARATDGRILPERLLRIPFEEVITDHLWSYGPVVAIGDPALKDERAPLGAARDFAADTEWQAKAVDLMRAASIVVAAIGQTEGFAWEIDRIVNAGLRSKLILLVPPVGAGALGVSAVQGSLRASSRRTRDPAHARGRIPARRADVDSGWYAERVDVRGGARCRRAGARGGTRARSAARAGRLRFQLIRDAGSRSAIIDPC
jgi:hypothetical protein